METKRYGAVSDLIVMLNGTLVFPQILAHGKGSALPACSLWNYVGHLCSEAFMSACEGGGFRGALYRGSMSSELQATLNCKTWWDYSVAFTF
jgi:hypothetical protein